MTDLERAAMQNVRELREALKAIREAVEELAPAGSVPSEEHLTPEPMREAEAIIRGIQAIADPAARERRAASSHNREGDRPPSIMAGDQNTGKEIKEKRGDHLSHLYGASSARFLAISRSQRSPFASRRSLS